MILRYLCVVLKQRQTTWHDLFTEIFLVSELFAGHFSLILQQQWRTYALSFLVYIRFWNLVTKVSQALWAIYISSLTLTLIQDCLRMVSSLHKQGLPFQNYLFGILKSKIGVGFCIDLSRNVIPLFLTRKLWGLLPSNTTHW